MAMPIVHHESRWNSEDSWLLAPGLEEAIPELQNIAQEKYFPEGSALFTAGELPAGLFLLRSGRIKLSLPLDRHSVLPSQVIDPGELIGLSETISGKPHEWSARVELSSRAVFFPRTAFLKIVYQNPAFCLAISSSISKQLDDAYERIRMIRSHHAESRKPGSVKKFPLHSRR